MNCWLGLDFDIGFVVLLGVELDMVGLGGSLELVELGGFVGLVGFMGLMGFMGVNGIIGFIGFMGVIGFIGFIVVFSIFIFIFGAKFGMRLGVLVVNVCSFCWICIKVCIVFGFDIVESVFGFCICCRKVGSWGRICFCS